MNNRRMPHLVAEQAGTVVGYAYAVPFRKRPAYRYTLKHSIYVRNDRLHAGIGRQLMTALIDACAAAGFRQMIGYIDGANVASIKLHERFGFRQVGYLPAVGYKFGRWTDSIMMQRSLGPGATEPPAGVNGRRHRYALGGQDAVGASAGITRARSAARATLRTFTLASRPRASTSCAGRSSGPKPAPS